MKEFGEEEDAIYFNGEAYYDIKYYYIDFDKNHIVMIFKNGSKLLQIFKSGDVVEFTPAFNKRMEKINEWKKLTKG